MGRRRSTQEDYEYAVRIGALVRQYRLACGITQAELARRLGTLDAAYVGHVERGDFLVPIPKLAKIAQALGVLTSDLLPPDPSMTGPISFDLLRSRGMSEEDAAKLIHILRQLDREHAAQADRSSQER